MRQPGRDDVIGAPPRFVFVIVFGREFIVDNGRSNEVPPRAPFIVVAGRFVLAELGGVNVCQPGLDDVIGAPPRFVFVIVFVREFIVDDGRSKELPPRAPFIVVAGREVLIGRDVVFTREPESKFPRAATFVPARGAVKKCCVLDGACRYEAGSAACPLAL